MTTFILKKCECGIIYYTIKNQISLLEDGWKTTSKFWLIEDLKTRGTVKREYKAIFPGPPRPLQMSENIILSACHFYLDHTYQRLSVFNPPNPPPCCWRNVWTASYIVNSVHFHGNLCNKTDNLIVKVIMLFLPKIVMNKTKIKMHLNWLCFYSQNLYKGNITCFVFVHYLILIMSTRIKPFSSPLFIFSHPVLIHCFG